MGWACSHCGDINPGETGACQECGTAKGQKSRLVLEPQPVSPNLIWVATLLGGALAGYAMAIWNGRVLRAQSNLRTATYLVLGIGGWLLCVYLIAHLTPPANSEPGFGIPLALALSFLLVSIPYNRDSLKALQWIWTHPARKLVFTLGRSHFGLDYTSFAKAEGQLFGSGAGPEPLLVVPVLPLILVVLSAVVGVLTVILGYALAV